MLYDPKRDRPSVLSMLLFCESKPADEAYEFMDCERCACAQFSHALGMKGRVWFTTFNEDIGTWLKLNWIAREEPRTFGALAARLRQEIK